MAHFNESEKQMDFDRGFVIDFNLETGLSKMLDTGKRYLGQMNGMFADQKAYEEKLKEGDPLVYEFHSMPAPETDGDFAFGCSILNPGTVVGRESNIYPLSSVRGVVPEHSIYKKQGEIVEKHED